jgi:hypothetical protein
MSKSVTPIEALPAPWCRSTGNLSAAAIMTISGSAQQFTALSVRFLAAALQQASPGSERLFDEIVRINPTRNLDLGELITASARLGPGRLERNRYDAAVAWPPYDVAGFLQSALNGAPTACLRELLADCPIEIAEWIESSGTAITFLGVDFDHRRYKLYLFRDRWPTLSDSIGLDAIAAALHDSAYIDCLELDMESVARARSAYWKLGDVSFADTLAPTYRPHRAIDNRVLRIPGRAAIVSALEPILAGQQRRNEPIIKFRRPRGVWAAPDAAELAAAAYAIECSLFDPQRLKYVNDYTDEILAIAAAFGCRRQVARWLAAVRPFDCYIHYVGVGEAFVTFYYKCSASLRREVMSVARG